MGCVDITNVFNVLIIVMILVCDFLVMLRRELGRSIFLEGFFGTHPKGKTSRSFINLLNSIYIPKFVTVG